MTKQTVYIQRCQCFTPSLLVGGYSYFITASELSFAKQLSISNFWDDVRKYNSSVVHGIFAMVPMLLKQPPEKMTKMCLRGSFILANEIKNSRTDLNAE